MNRKLTKSVVSWLDSESRDRTDEADRALFEAFSHLPQAPLPTDFTAAVLGRLGLAPTPAAARFPAWSQRLAAALFVLFGVVAVLFLPDIFASAGFLLGRLDLVALGASAVATVSQWFGEGLAVWKALAQAGEMLAGVLGSPQILAGLAMGAAFSIGAFRLLYELMIVQRSSYHARPV